MFVSHKALNGRNLMTDFCKRRAERKWCRLAEEEARAGEEADIITYGILLDPITVFRYLRIVLLADDDN